MEGYDGSSLELLPFNLIEGRFPQTNKEIVIEKWITKYLGEDIKIGDQINLNMGHRRVDESDNEISFDFMQGKEYNIVGFIQPRIMWSGNLVTHGITGLGEETQGSFNAYVKLADIKNAQEKLEGIAENIGYDIQEIEYNDRVLRLSAESTDQLLNNRLWTLVLFIVGIIIISTIAVIYNSFNISVLERVSQFGLLRSIGATPTQIRGIVLREAFSLSVIGIPIGILSGIGSMKIVFYIIGRFNFDANFFREMEANLSWTVLLISTIIGIITVFLSAIGPARKAAKVSPLEAVRNAGSIKKESFKRVKNSFIVRRLLGIEGEIAYKNLRRNRKRFYITVFSMVISISLYITFSSFSDYMFKAGAIDSTFSGNYSINMNDQEEFEKVYWELKGIKDIDRIFKISGVNGEALLEENKISKDLKEEVSYILSDKKDDFIRIHNNNLYTLGDENLELLEEHLEQGSLEALDKEYGVLVVNNTYVWKEHGSRKLMEGFHVNTGDTIPFGNYGGEDVEYKELEVVGVLDQSIIDEGYNINAGLIIITTEDNFKRILGEDSAHNNRMMIEMIENSDPTPIKAYLEEKQEGNPFFNYMDYAQWAEANRMTNVIMSIFLYGFVTLITLISSINIINTISTNIILRTKEISMIKAVGMTQGSIKRMVALESLFYGIFAAIIGGAIGIGLSYGLFGIVTGISDFQWAVPWGNVAIACLGATIVALLSGSYPLKRINEGIIVENMKVDE